MACAHSAPRDADGLGEEAAAAPRTHWGLSSPPEPSSAPATEQELGKRVTVANSSVILHLFKARRCSFSLLLYLPRESLPRNSLVYKSHVTDEETGLKVG